MRRQARSFVIRIVGYIPPQPAAREHPMKVHDILRLKGHALYTIAPGDDLADAARIMDEQDIGSLVVMASGRLAGMVTFREMIRAAVANGGSFQGVPAGQAMDANPLTCTSDTDMNEVRRMMLERHARYLPVIDGDQLTGVISFYDVAKAVVDSQNFENRMLKAYIRDWPEDEGEKKAGAS
jgi:CBS domain-containing protein